MRPTGVGSGFHTSVLAGMGRLVFQGVASGMARAIEQVNSGFAQLIENKVAGPMTVHARSETHSFDQTINPDDVKGYYENIVTLKAEAPEEREREAMLGIRLYQSDLISKYEAMRRAGINNPLEMMNQQAAEKVAFSPQAMDSQINEFMQQLGGEMQQQLGMESGTNLGNQFMPGQSQLQRPGEATNQRNRMAAQAQPDVFPQGIGGLDALAATLGTAPGGTQGMPSGQQVGRNQIG
jgi:hypothetical protein